MSKRILENKLIELYDEWLMETYPEEITCSDDLCKLQENNVYVENFFNWINEVL